VLERHECTHFQVLYVGQVTEYFAPGDLFAGSAAAIDDDARKRCPDVGAL